MAHTLAARVSAFSADVAAIAVGALVLTAASAYQVVPLPAALLAGARWLAVAALVAYAWRARSLTTWILVSIVVGAVVGHDAPGVAVSLRIFSQIFLRLIRTIVAPLLFATLVVGIAGHPNLKQVGRMGVKALVYFEVITTLALFIGWAAISFSQAGVGVSLTGAAGTPPLQTTAQRTWQEIVLAVFPENIVRSVAEADMLQVVVFSVIFGVALALIPGEKRRPMLAFAESLAETMFRFTNIVMYLAPLGVGAAIAYTVGQLGVGVLVNLLKLLATFYVAVAVFVGAVLLPVALMARVPIRRFIAAMAEPISIAFATTSSEAALPRAMEAMERFGVPRPVVAFVIPTGYSFNLDGSSLYLSLGAIFVAQAAGIDLTVGQQLLLLFTLMLTSKGVAGVPRGSLVILMGTVGSFGLPVEPVFVMLGIDALLDMVRTSLNVLGNCLASVVIARWEGVYDDRAADVAAEVPAGG
jgi:proton glutamate symport protein